MKRSDILQILARRLSNREVDDIREAALAEMAFVQQAVLEKLPNQPWFLEKETIVGLPVGVDFIELPEDYNGLMTHGGVWFQAATLKDTNKLTGMSVQASDTDAVFTPESPCGVSTVNVYDYTAFGLGTRVNLPLAEPNIPLDECIHPTGPTADGVVPVCPSA